jgi:hypothetical protein
MLVNRTFCIAVLLAVSAVVASASPIVANLQPVTGVPGLLRDAQSYTISQINTAGGIVIGDKVFELFTVTSTNSINAVAPGAGEIAITAVQINGDYGMKINGGWSASAGQVSDSTIEFHATLLPEFLQQGYAFKDNSLFITAFGVANNTTGGSVSVSENLYAHHPALGGGSFVNKYVYYKSDTDNLMSDHREFAPIQDMWVLKDVVANGGIGTGGSAHISEFYQTFSQVPEPATLTLLAVGGLAILRRKRN